MPGTGIVRLALLNSGSVLGSSGVYSIFGVAVSRNRSAQVAFS